MMIGLLRIGLLFVDCCFIVVDVLFVFSGDDIDGLGIILVFFLINWKVIWFSCIFICVVNCLRFCIIEGGCCFIGIGIEGNFIVIGVFVYLVREV